MSIIECSLNVRHIVQWDSTSCFLACKKMVSEFNPALEDAGPDEAIWLASGEDPQGHIIPDVDKLQAARAQIDEYLKALKPVIVGISHQDASYNRDKITDHFVVICTLEKYPTQYTFLDPATSGVNKRSTFYEGMNGVLYRPGTNAQGPVVGRTYEVSCVRRYK